MEIGAILALLSALAFAGNQVLVRRATHQANESFTAMAMTLLIGTPPFALITYLTGEWYYLWSISWRAIILLISAGIVQFIIVTYVYYSAIRMLGANKAVSIARTNIIISILFGIFFLNEHVTAFLVIGALFIMAGAILVSIGNEKGSVRVPQKGVFLALGAALGMATSAAFIRLAMQEFPHVFAGTFLAYIASFILIVFITVSSHSARRNLLLQKRETVLLLTVVSFAMLAAHVLRFAALIYSPVSVVQPLQGTIALFVFALSWIANRRIDVFNWRVIAAILLVSFGTFLVSY
ncbi:DMT family transporter [Chloroflexota bacterium]